MAIYVKAHRRGKSVVRAYKRADAVMQKIDYTISGRTPYKRRLSLANRGQIARDYKAKASRLLARKMAVGRAIFGRHQIKTYYSKAIGRRVTIPE